MLKINIPGREMFDERTQEFVYTKDTELTLEHSLISVSRWESKWKRCFVISGPKNYEETIDYIKCMCVNKQIPDDVTLKNLTQKDLKKINDYIADSMSASNVISLGQQKSGKHGNSDSMTSEMIYFYMCSFNIPFECEKWHFNRLLKLIEIANIKNNPGKKMSNKSVLQSYSRLNAERRAKYHTKG